MTIISSVLIVDRRLIGVLRYFDAVLVVDKAHNVIARNRMAAAREDKLVDILRKERRNKA